MSDFGSSARSALRDRLVLTGGALALTVFALHVVLLVWKLPEIIADRSVIALHYNIFFGVDRVGEWKRMLIIPVFGALSIGLGFFFGLIWYGRSSFLSQVLFFSAAAMNILFLAASVFILLANL